MPQRYIYSNPPHCDHVYNMSASAIASPMTILIAGELHGSEQERTDLSKGQVSTNNKICLISGIEIVKPAAHGATNETAC